MQAELFKIPATMNPSEYAPGGKTRFFISHNLDPILLQNNYFGIKAGDVLYVRSANWQTEFKNIRITVSYPPSEMIGPGGLHFYTNDLVVADYLHFLSPQVEISNFPWTDTVDTTITYYAPQGKVVADLLNPPVTSIYTADIPANVTVPVINPNIGATMPPSYIPPAPAPTPPPPPVIETVKVAAPVIERAAAEPPVIKQVNPNPASSTLINADVIRSVIKQVNPNPAAPVVAPAIVNTAQAATIQAAETSYPGEKVTVSSYENQPLINEPAPAEQPAEILKTLQLPIKQTGSTVAIPAAETSVLWYIAAAASLLIFLKLIKLI